MSYYVVKIGNGYNICKNKEAVVLICDMLGLPFTKDEEFEEHHSFFDALRAVLIKNDTDPSVIDGSESRYQCIDTSELRDYDNQQ